MNISKWSVSTPLYASLRIESTQSLIERQKLLFLERLQMNSYTSKILVEISKNNFENSLLHDVSEMLALQPSTPLNELVKAAHKRIKKIEQMNNDIYSDEYLTADIRQIFQIKNSKRRRLLLSKALENSGA